MTAYDEDFMMIESTSSENQTSWERMKVSYSQDLQYALTEQLKRPLRVLLNVVEVISHSERARLFRAGQSLSNLIVSRTSYHGLKNTDPFVSAEIHIDPVTLDHSFTITYWRADGDAVQQWICSGEDILSTLDLAFVRLWNDTADDTAALPRISDATN
jgi:hypothetical protein